MNFIAIIQLLASNWQNIVAVLAAIYGLLTAIVKFFPTLPETSWILKIIKFLGKITNRQTDDNAVRSALAQIKSDKK